MSPCVEMTLMNRSGKRRIDGRDRIKEQKRDGSGQDD